MSDKEQRVVIQKILTEQIYSRLPEYIVYTFSCIIEETKGDITEEKALEYLGVLKASDLINWNLHLHLNYIKKRDMRLLQNF